MTNNPHRLTDSRIAQTEDEAEKRFKVFKSSDPFPSIPPALLNSADISDYVAETGMVYPFEDNEERLKSASYRVNFLGECIYWDEKGEKQVLHLNKGEEFKLKPNSIVFITPEPMFRLPDYIAMRFNLEIRHIHKGILLGTGPLVDPGFVGKLLVPLHNLTANEYTFRGGDPIIWIEFTKLSPNDSWNRNVEIKERQGVFRGFPASKSRLGVEVYLEKAVGRERQVRSSIPVVIEESKKRAIKAEEYADQAKKDAHRIRNIITFASIIVLLPIIITLLTLILNAVAHVNTASKEVPELKLKVQSLEEKVNTLEQQLHNTPQQSSVDSANKTLDDQQPDSRKATPSNAGRRATNTNQ